MTAGGASKTIDVLVEKYHGLLFTLPTAKRMMAYVLLISASSGLLFGLPLARSGSPTSILVSASFFTLAELVSWVLDALLLKGDPIMDSRRCLGFELFSLMALAPMSALGGLLAYATSSGPSLALRMASVGVSLSISARTLTIAAASLAGITRSSACILIGPLAWLASAYSSILLTSPMLSRADLVFSSLCLALGSLASLALVLSINKASSDLFSTGAMRAARAFFACWITDYNEPLETFLDEVGVSADTSASIMLFEGLDGRPIGALVVPGVHPGPFRDAGSSPLPGLIQEVLEERLGCPVAVPHGLSGHDLNLTSKRECEKLIRALIEDLAGLKGPFDTASPMSRSSGRRAKACCQLFGPIALTVLTTAPEPSEDFPREIETILRDKAAEMGLYDVVIVDAHNCINGLTGQEGLVEEFSEVASEAIKKAVSSPGGPFKAGMARTRPPEFSLEDGMGPGGISVLALEVAGKRYAYVVVDGNNMIKGLREHILAKLAEMGFKDAEVMTTDTHVVNARLLVERGYHPVGEAMDWDLLSKYVLKAAREALEGLRPAVVKWARVRASVKVFGKEQLDKLCELPVRGLRAAKKAVLSILLPVQVFSIALAFLL